jgi:hypothetical protein
MIEGIEFGYAQNVDTEWCARSLDVESRMLCGRKKGWVPVQQPAFTPENLHQMCREALFGKWTRRDKPDPVEYGTCPVCVGAVPVFDGKVQGHGQWTYADGMARVSEVRCAGEGQPPEVES